MRQPEVWAIGEKTRQYNQPDLDEYGQKSQKIMDLIFSSYKINFLK